MTLTRFVTKSAFRNRRRSLLTVLSITFSLVLLTLMMTVWKNWYVDQGTAQSAQRLITRHRVSLTQSMPIYYAAKMRAVPGVVAVAPTQWFGGLYKDDKPENMFMQFATDPNELFKVQTDFKIPPDQLAAWQKDQAGTVVDSELAKKFGWKIGDRIFIKGRDFPANLELTVRGIFTAPDPTMTIYFHLKYLEETISYFKDRAGTFNILADSPEDVTKVATTIDSMFRNSPEPTKTETEKGFLLSFINSLGNVKAFILSICGAVIFATLLVSANTMAMSIRERTREVAVLKTLGFTRQSILGLYVGEAVTVALIGGIAGCLLAMLLVTGLAHAPGMGFFFVGMKIGVATFVLALVIAGTVGFLSAVVPAYHAAKIDIVEGLRYIG
jgi:putative ABC transport system permease protein